MPFMAPLLIAAGTAVANRLGDKSGDLSRRARDTLRDNPVPTQDQLVLELEELVRQGVLTPEQIPLILQGESAYQQIGSDPRLRDAQGASLQQLQEIAGSGGLDAIGRLGVEDALERSRTEAQGARQAIMADARRRGQGGSDAALVDALVAQQGSATRGNRAALEQAGIAQQRRDAAITQGATLAGNMRQQDFGEASTKAGAADLIARYNAQNAQDVATRNTAARNIAQESNLAERQRVSDANTGTRNTEQQYNRALPMELYKMRAGQQGAIADTYTNQALLDSERNKQMVSTVGSGLAAAYGTTSDVRAKEEIAPLDSSALLKDLAGYEFQYKGDPTETRQPGIMAQDLERTPMADAVVERPEDHMKMIDGQELGIDPKWLAVLTDVSKRVDALEGRG